MVFSRLLLATKDAKNYIAGQRKGDKLVVQAKPGEIALCFQIDDYEEQNSHVLDLNRNDTRCDGLIFYAKDGEEQKVICLVEMKSSTHIDKVAAQIEATKKRVEGMLRQECGSHYTRLLSKIIWKAGFYSYGASDGRKMQKIYSDLKKAGFDDIQDFDRARGDATSFLRGENSAKNAKSRLKSR